VESFEHAVGELVAHPCACLLAAARLLLEPVFALIGTLLRLLVIVGAAVAVVVLLVSGSAHAAGPGATGADRPATSPLR